MANQVTGRVFIKADGSMLRSKEGAKLMFGGFERETVVGNTVHGYTEKVAAPTVECTISHQADTSLKSLAAIKDATLTFETDTGRAYIVRNAWLSSPPELTGGSGEVSLKFAGVSCEEI